MSLIAKLQERGVKVYASTPLWLQLEVIDSTKISDNCVVTEREYKENKVYSVCIEDGENRVYIPLKQGISPDKDEYSIVEFEATRDWEEFGIKKGDKKVFAV